MTDLIVDLFAGPGGWSEALAALGRVDVGLELDLGACATRAAAGHLTIRTDVARYPRPPAGTVEGLIASPPCPLFSAAGKRAGGQLTAELQAAIVDALAGRPTLARHRKAMARRLQATYHQAPPNIARLDQAARSARAWAEANEAALTVQPAAWIHAVRPRWIALEQVPAVLPFWRTYARELRRLGYSAWCGVLNCADYGVPQTRQRAILLASADRTVSAPARTHAEGGAMTLFGDLAPWVTMAEALGWTGEDTPARTVCGDRSPRWLYPDPSGRRGRTVGFPRRDDRGQADENGYRRRDWRTDDRPAPTITRKARSMVVRNGQATEKGQGRTEPYERSVDEPAPTVTGAGNMRVILNTGRDSKGAGAPRETCQTIDPATQPAPTFTVKSGGQWQLRVAAPNYDDVVRPADAPAPTLAFGRNASGWTFERPATTVQGAAQVWPPGHKFNSDDIARLGEEEARRRYGDRAGTDAIPLTLGEALILQGFDPAYPVTGNKTAQFQQVGNAVPPTFAIHLLAEVLGLQIPQEYPR